MSPRELLLKKLRNNYEDELSKTYDAKTRSELKANKNLATVFFFLGAFTILALILNLCGVFKLDMVVFVPVAITVAALSFGSFVVISTTKRTRANRNQIIKYTLLINLMLCCAALDCTLTFHVPLIMLIPIAIASWYFDRKTMLFVMITSFVFLIGDSFLWPLTQVEADLNLFGANSFAKLNHAVVPELADFLENNVADRTPVDYWQYMSKLLPYSLLPRSFVFCILSATCYITSNLGKSMVDEQIEIANKHARIDGELGLATEIQANMLPKIFPNIPTHEKIDLYASMHPAKEVGGDLYDFFKIDDKRIAIVIADVSGKGVPAALFMAISKSLIKNTLFEHDVSTTMRMVNNTLCDGNLAGLFVTAWVGILDTESGELKYANAGHNPPVIKLSGEVSFLTEKSGIPMGLYADLEYIEHHAQMKQGDRILLYTDGVTEATSANNELYGEDRLLQFLASHKGEDNAQLLEDLKADLDAFALGTEQFDDITMLALTLK